MAAATAVRRTQKRGSDGSPFRVFLPLSAAFLIIAGIAIYGAISPYNAKKPPPPGSRGSLVWGDGIFANSAQLKAWLRLHGASYDTWAKSHPRALALVRARTARQRAALAKARAKSSAHRAAAAKATTTKVAATRTATHPTAVAPKKHVTKVASKPSPVKPLPVKPSPVATVPAPALASTSSSSERRIGVWIVVILGLLFGLLAAVPHRLLRRAGVHLGSRESEVRLAAVGAGAALLLGVIAATVLG